MSLALRYTKREILALLLEVIVLVLWFKGVVDMPLAYWILLLAITFCNALAMAAFEDQKKKLKKAYAG